MISVRRLWPLAGLLLMALVPTVVHGYIGYVVDAPAITVASVPERVDGAIGSASAPKGPWIVDTYGTESIAERTYQAPGGGRVGLFVARGFDLKKLYHHPELGVLRGHTFAPLRAGDVGGQPVHILQGERESAVYALVYDGQWIANPYWLQLSSAFTSLWTGRQPLTLVLAHGDVLRDGQPSAFTAALLREAVRALP